MERFILSSSKGLAGVPKSKSKTVQFIHESVRDYLLKGKGFDTLRAGLGNISGQSHDKLKECCKTYLALDKSEYLPPTLPLITKHQKEEMDTLRQKANDRFPFLQYATDNMLYHSDRAHENGISQLDFLCGFFPSEVNKHAEKTKYSLRAWIYTRNLFEKFQVRRYSPDANLLYILVEKDLPNLIRVELSRVPHMDIKGERYGFPLLAAVVNNRELAIRALLAAESSSLTAGEYEEAIQCVLESRNEIVSQDIPEPLLSWAVSKGPIRSY